MAGFVDFSRALALASVVGGLALPASAQTRYPYSLTLYDQPDYRGGSVTFYGDNANIGSTGFATRARSAQIRGTWRLCEGGGYRNRCEVLAANIRDLEAYGFAGRVGSAQLLGAGAQPPATPAPYAPPPYEPPAYAPPAYGPLPAAPAPPPAQPYRPSPYAAPPPAAPLAPATAPAPGYAAPYAPGPYEAAPQTLPPAVDAPLSGPGRFGRPYGPPPAAPVPEAYAPPPYQPAPYPAPAPAPPYAGQVLQGTSTVFFPSPALRGADVSAVAPGAADSFCRAQGLGPAVFFDQGQRLPRSLDPEGRPVGEGPVLRDVLCRR